jgi:hypothetical protein
MCETFWANVCTIFAGLGGAVIGSTIAYLFQNRVEKLKSKENRKGIIYKYSIFLDRINSQAKLINDNYLLGQKENKLRHINVPAIMFVFPNFDLNDPAVDLVFLIEYENSNVNLIANLMTIKDRFSILVNMVQIRNNIHINELQPIFSKLQITGGMTSEQEIEKIIGKVIYSKMKSATDTIYDQIEYITQNYRRIKDELGKALKQVHSKAKLIEFSDKKNL